MNWMVLISTVVALAGWYVGHVLNSKRDAEKKRKDIKMEYLTDALRKLYYVSVARQAITEEKYYSNSLIRYTIFWNSLTNRYCMHR